MVGPNTHYIDPNFKQGGTKAAIEQLDLTTSFPQTVVIVDGSGVQITSFGGGTQYSDGDANADPTGTVAMGTDGSNIYALHTDTSGDLQVDILNASIAVTNAGLTELAAAINASSQMDVNIAANGIGLATSAKQDTIIGHVDGIEGLLTTIDSDTGGLAAAFGSVQLTLTTQIDNLSNDSDALLTSSMLYGYDGATWDRLRADSTDGLLVNLGANNDVSLNAGTNNIGDIDVLTLPITFGAGAVAATTPRVTLASNDPGVGLLNDILTAVDDLETTTAGIRTSSELIDDAIYATDGALGKSMAIGAVFDDVASVAITENQGGYLRMSSRRALLVEGVASGTAINVLDTNSAAALTALQTIDNAISGAGFNITQFNGEAIDVGAGTEAAALRVTLPTDGTGVVKLGAGTAEIGKLAAGVANIGDVDVLTIAAGDNNIGNVDIVSGTITTVSTVTAVTTLTGGGIAHDSADSGNPIKVGMKAYSPDGTTPGTAVAEADRTDAKSDLDGRLFVNNRSPRQLHKHLDGTAAYTDEALIASPGAGFQAVITSIIFSSGEAVAINFFLEESATKIFGPIYIEAVAGRGFVSGPIYLPITTATAVTITTSAANDQSVDVDYFIQAV